MSAELILTSANPGMMADWPIELFVVSQARWRGQSAPAPASGLGISDMIALPLGSSEWVQVTAKVRVRQRNSDERDQPVTYGQVAMAAEGQVKARIVNNFAGMTGQLYIPPQPATQGALIVSLMNIGPYPVTIKSAGIFASPELQGLSSALYDQTGWPIGCQSLLAPSTLGLRDLARSCHDYPSGNALPHCVQRISQSQWGVLAAGAVELRARGRAWVICLGSLPLLGVDLQPAASRRMHPMPGNLRADPPSSPAPLAGRARQAMPVAG